MSWSLGQLLVNLFMFRMNQFLMLMVIFTLMFFSNIQLLWSFFYILWMFNIHLMYHFLLLGHFFLLNLSSFILYLTYLRFDIYFILIIKLILFLQGFWNSSNVVNPNSGNNFIKLFVNLLHCALLLFKDCFLCHSILSFQQRLNSTCHQTKS